MAAAITYTQEPYTLLGLSAYANATPSSGLPYDPDTEWQPLPSYNASYLAFEPGPSDKNIGTPIEPQATTSACAPSLNLLQKRAFDTTNCTLVDFSDRHVSDHLSRRRMLPPVKRGQIRNPFNPNPYRETCALNLCAGSWIDSGYFFPFQTIDQNSHPMFVDRSSATPESSHRAADEKQQGRPHLSYERSFEDHHLVTGRLKCHICGLDNGSLSNLADHTLANHTLESRECPPSADV
jgi:hypothetical protein